MKESVLESLKDKNKSDPSDTMHKGVERQASDFLPAGFDPVGSMQILIDYLVKMEEAFNELVKKSDLSHRQMEASMRSAAKRSDDLLQEKENLVKDLLNLSSQVEELESMLASCSQKIDTFEKQSRKLHRANEELEVQLLKKQNDSAFYMNEVERLTKDFETINNSLSSSNSRMDELERKLQGERNQVLTNEKEIRRLNSLLSEAQSKNKLLETKLAELLLNHTNELKSVTEKHSSEFRHEVSMLKKRIKLAILPELEDFQKLKDEKQSPDLASSLKALMGRFVSKLEQIGLDTKR
ncbi:MAG: hypothetical protein LBV23_08205 [Deltaproteobacteria bacterium]|nr:hypothetical protein [Deltaproteobacteria bacterium]